MQRPFLRAILIILAIASAIWFVSKLLDIISHPTFTDYRVYFKAAEAAQKGERIYDLPGMRERTFDPFYKYIPLFAYALKFFVIFGLRNMAFLWFFLSILFYLVSLVLWINMHRISFRSLEFLIIISALFASRPAIASLNGPQMDSLMLLLLFICYYGITRSYPIISGGALAALTMIKVFPVVLILDFFQSRRIRAIWAFIISCSLLVSISILLAGIQPNVEFLFDVLPANSAGTAYIENQSLFGFLSRFFVDGTQWNSGHPLNLPEVKWTAHILSMILLIAMIYVTKTQNNQELFFPAIVVWLLIALPVVWIHYQTLLFFPFVVFLHYQIHQRAEDHVGWFLLIASWLCIAIGDQSRLLNAPVILQSYKFYGVVILWVLYIRSMLSQPIAIGKKIRQVGVAPS